MLKTFTPAVDLPDAAKNALELAQNRVATLEGEQSRLQGAVGELKTEMVSLEHLITETTASLKDKKKESGDTHNLILARTAELNDLGLKCADAAITLKEMKSDIATLQEQKNVLMAAIIEAREQKNQMDIEYLKMLEKISEKQSIISGLIEHIKQVSALL